MRSLSLACVLLAGFAFSLAARAATYTSVDNHFTAVSGNYVHQPDFPAQFTFTVTFQSDTSYPDVQIVFPFAYGDIDNLPPSLNQATAYGYNNSTHRWEDGSKSIAIYGVAGQNSLINMSNTVGIATDYLLDLLNNPDVASSIAPNADVPILDLGAFSAGVDKSFNFDVLTSDGEIPAAIKNLDVGFFVVESRFIVVTPEPASLSLLVFSVLGLLARQRRRMQNAE